VVSVSILLPTVLLEDEIREGCQQHTGDKWMKTLSLQLVPLAEFREGPIDIDESFTIYWTKDGARLDAFANKTWRMMTRLGVMSLM
jgi:hypothetical protein